MENDIVEIFKLIHESQPEALRPSVYGFDGFTTEPDEKLSIRGWNMFDWHLTSRYTSGKGYTNGTDCFVAWRLEYNHDMSVLIIAKRIRQSDYWYVSAYSSLTSIRIREGHRMINVKDFKKVTPFVFESFVQSSKDGTFKLAPFNPLINEEGIRCTVENCPMKRLVDIMAQAVQEHRKLWEGQPYEVRQLVRPLNPTAILKTYLEDFLVPLTIELPFEDKVAMKERLRTVTSEIHQTREKLLELNAMAERLRTLTSEIPEVIAKIEMLEEEKQLLSMRI